MSFGAPWTGLTTALLLTEYERHSLFDVPDVMDQLDELASR